MGVAVVKQIWMLPLLAVSGFVFMGAAPPEEEAMLEAFDHVLTAMFYAATGLCLFAIVWGDSS